MSNWSGFKKIGFRFIFLYSALFIAFVNNDAYPFWGYIIEYPNKLLQKIIPFIAENALGILNKVSFSGPNGSGDTTYDYVCVFTLLLIAFLGTFIWSFLDFKRKEYKTLYYWLITAVRYYVGLMLIVYGLYKIIPLQFPQPSFARLIEPYGSSSPMGLAWTFLGFSAGYNTIMGIAELLAGLLLFRRTTTFGALVTLTVSINIMAINYFYDVPVKIVSTHLVLFSILILSKDGQKLFNFFFKEQSILLTQIKRPKFKQEWLNKVFPWLKIIPFGYIALMTYEVLEADKEFGNKSPKPAIYGLFEVEKFKVNNQLFPALKTDTTRWDYFIVENNYYAIIQRMDGKKMRYSPKIDTLKHTITLESFSDSTMIETLNYLEKDSLLILEGIVAGDTIYCETKRKKIEDFLLMNRGFNWINEHPFNR